MDMTGDVELDAPRATVWDALNDTAVLARCIPGCESMTLDASGAYLTTVVSRVGPIKARFNGKVTLADVDAPHRYTLIGEGTGGAAGFAKAQIEVRLVELTPDTTRLSYVARAQIGGKLAQLGSRMIDATARKSAAEFFDTFQACVGGEPAAPSVARSWSAALIADGVAPQAAARVASPRTQKGTPSPEIAAMQAGVRAAAAERARSALAAGVIQVALRDAIAVVTLNRPESRNAMTLEMWGAMPAIMSNLERDPSVRVVLLAGAGADFCSGADIAEFESVRATVDQATEYEVAVDACCDAIADCRKPTLAVLRGDCLGGGLHLAMSCDFRFASVDSMLGIPAGRLSIVYGVSATQKLLALVGISPAKRILYGGERLHAVEARAIGLVDEIAVADPTPDGASWLDRLLGRRTPQPVAGDPLDRATRLAKVLAANAPLSISGTKYILNGLAIGARGLDEERAEVLIREAAASRDYKEGRDAFVQRRAPRFEGR